MRLEFKWDDNKAPGQRIDEPSARPEKRMNEMKPRIYRNLEISPARQRLELKNDWLAATQLQHQQHQQQQLNWYTEI